MFTVGVLLFLYGMNCLTRALVHLVVWWAFDHKEKS